MKKTICCILFIGFLFYACEKSNLENTVEPVKVKEKLSNEISIATQQEYEMLDKQTKVLVDQINSSVRALQGLREYNETGYKDYSAMFTFSTDKANTNIFSGVIAIAPEEPSNNQTPSDQTSSEHGSCHVCGLSSAMKCIKEVTANMKANHLTEIDVHVKLAGNCVDITY